MSEVSSHSKVHSISCTKIAASVGVTLIGTIVAAILEGYRGGSRNKALRTSSRAKERPERQPPLVEGLDTLEIRRLKLERKAFRHVQDCQLNPLDALKHSTLRGLEGAGYVVNRRAIEPLLRRFIDAPDIVSARKAREALVQGTHEEHRQVLRQNLILACRNAVIKVGFDRVEIAQGPLGGVRLIAMNPEGKALISEIDTGDSARAPRIETEVVGTYDDSCVSILDDFDQALEKEGVRSDPPDRRHTGGVCELAAAREFVRRKVERPVKSSPVTILNAGAPESTRSDAPVRRAQRLNRKSVQRQQ